MTRIVVTGAAGFVGQHLVRRLLSDGFDGAAASVAAIGRQMERFPADLTGRCDVRVLDLATSPLAEIGEACGDDALVFHLAADASVAGGPAACANNVRSTERLVEALRNRAPRRIVYVSSIGAVDRRPSDPCDRPLTEDSPPHPLTAYGQSKLEGERVVASSGLPFSVVRPTWVYGPGMRENSHLRVFLEMVRRGAPGARFRFPGRVSVIHVDDLCTALVLVARQAESAGRTKWQVAYWSPCTAVHRRPFWWGPGRLRCRCWPACSRDAASSRSGRD